MKTLLKAFSFETLECLINDSSHSVIKAYDYDLFILFKSRPLIFSSFSFLLPITLMKKGLFIPQSLSTVDLCEDIMQREGPLLLETCLIIQWSWTWMKQAPAYCLNQAGSKIGAGV